MKFKRILYLFYYIRTLNRVKFNLFLTFSRNKVGKPKLFLLYDTIASVFIYNISILEYFQFRFFEKKRDERKKWAGTGFMYEYQLKMNPKGAREVLENKIFFLNYFRKFIKRKFYSIDVIRSDGEFGEKLLSDFKGKLVLKGSHGQTGAEVEVIRTNEFSADSLIRYMDTKKYDLVEEYVIQHPSLMELSPSGLNTIRIFTQLNNDVVDFLGARLRISVNSSVDNMAAGNLAAPVDLEEGIVTGPGVYSDITKEDQAVHPVTGKYIAGFAIPHWNAVIELARNAALQVPENRSVGWDIAVTENGPELIEGNHNWCKLLWQMPVKMGLKAELEKYMVESKKKEVRI